MSDAWANKLQTALHHAAADLLLRLENAQRGWSTLQADEPWMHDAIDLASKTAAAHGVPVAEIAVAAQHMLAAVAEVANGDKPAADVKADTTPPEPAKAGPKK